MYTRGFSYEGYATKYLQIVRDKVIAVSGRVTDKSGKPLYAVAVCGWRTRGMTETLTAGCDTTDHDGYYTLSRLNMDKGVYYVGLEGEKSMKRVEVKKSRTVTNVDFVR